MLFFSASGGKYAGSLFMVRVISADLLDSELQCFRLLAAYYWRRV